MSRRLLDVGLLLAALANAHHLTVAACRYYASRALSANAVASAGE